MAIGRTNAGGGGTSLNFKVVGGTTQPTSPKENTIWVNTDVAIPSWAFSTTEPGSPAAGMVWFSTGTSSTAEFNALKKNDIQVYPSSANQYLGGQWVGVEAYIYKSGVWVQLSYKFPVEYQRVEYLQGTGTQYIITDFTPTTTDTYRHEYKFNAQEINNEAYLIGVGGDNRYNCYIGSNRMGWNIGAENDNPDLRTGIVANTDYIVDCTIAPTTLTATINGMRLSGTCSVLAPSASLGLLGRRNVDGGTGGINPAKAKLYYWRIYKNNVLIHEFVPCYRKSDSVAGMYDTVGAEFYANAGTGTFIVGGDDD